MAPVAPFSLAAPAIPHLTRSLAPHADFRAGETAYMMQASCGTVCYGSCGDFQPRIVTGKEFPLYPAFTEESTLYFPQETPFGQYFIRFSQGYGQEDGFKATYIIEAYAEMDGETVPGTFKVANASLEKLAVGGDVGLTMNFWAKGNKAMIRAHCDLTRTK